MKTIQLIALTFICVACEQTGSAPKLQGQLAAAKTSTAQTSTHIKAGQSNLERIDYKATRARKLLDEGIERPE